MTDQLIQEKTYLLIESQLNIAKVQKKTPNIQEIKIQKTTSKNSKILKELLQKKIVGSMNLKIYNTKKDLIQQLNKKIEDNICQSFIKLDSFFLEMPEDNHKKWHLDCDSAENLLKTIFLNNLNIVLLPNSYTKLMDEKKNNTQNA